MTQRSAFMRFDSPRSTAYAADLWSFAKWRSDTNSKDARKCADVRDAGREKEMASGRLTDCGSRSSRRAALFNLSQQSRQLRCFVCDSAKADPFQGRAVKHAKMQSASAPNRMAASDCGHAWPRPGGVLNCGVEIRHVSAGEDLVKNRQWLRSRGVTVSFTLRLLCDGGFKFRFTQSFDQDGHARLVQDFDKFQGGRFMRV